MNPERYARVSEIFAAARRLDPRQREAYLDQACAGDSELRREVDLVLARAVDLTNQLGTEALRAKVGEFAADTLADDEADSIPESVGRYRIICRIGEGGMGTVFEAEQDNPRRTVALKVIRPGVGDKRLLRRFEHEAHVLGQLQHPGIAHVYEAGMTDLGHPGAPPQPYFAMEFIRGRSLSEHVNYTRPGTGQRLALLAAICDAVEHAHQKGVIHRDLKPGNILVDESGQSKILDFGVARATDSDIRATTMHTDMGQLIGTVPYMSPEQVEADPDLLDTRSDVYALGVVGFEMLTGRLPYDVGGKMIHDAVRVIREDEPTRLSSINRALRGDVETIIGKALEKDKTRRYQSAAALAADIRRHLEDEPIVARPASTAYQIRKFAKRHKALVGGAVVVILVLVAGVVAERRQRVAAESARDQALAQARRARRIADFLDNMIQQAEPEDARGRVVTVGDVLDSVANDIGTELKDDPEVEAAIRQTVGRAYHSLARFDEADVMLSKALEIRREQLEYQSEDTADLLNELGLLRIEQGRSAEAIGLLDDAEAVARLAVGPEHILTLRIISDRGSALQRLGRFDEAEVLLRELLAARQKRLDPEHRLVVSTKFNLGVVLKARGKYADAEPLLRGGLEWFRRNDGRLHPRTSAAIANVMDLDKVLGRLDSAEELAEEGVRIDRELYGPHHAHYALSLANLAEVKGARGRPKEAESLYRQALQVREGAFGADHPQVARTLVDLSGELSEQTRHQEAEELQRRALAIYRTNPDADGRGTARALYELAQTLMYQKRYDEAEDLQRKALKLIRELLGNDHPTTLRFMSGLGNILNSKRDFESLEPLVTEVLETRRRILGEDHVDVTFSMYNLAMVRWRSGNPAGAEPLVREARKRFVSHYGDKHPMPLNALHYLAKLCAELDRPDEAEQLYVQAVEGRRELFGEGHRHTLASMNGLAALHEGQGRYAEAEPIRLEAFRIAKENHGSAHEKTIKATEELIALYDAWGKPEEVDAWRRELPTSHGVDRD